MKWRDSLWEEVITSQWDFPSLEIKRMSEEGVSSDIEGQERWVLVIRETFKIYQREQHSGRNNLLLTTQCNVLSLVDIFYYHLSLGEFSFGESFKNKMKNISIQ